MRIVETRNLGASRLQIAEQSATGWTITVFSPDSRIPIVFRSEDPTSLEELIEQAHEQAAGYERGQIPR